MSSENVLKNLVIEDADYISFIDDFENFHFSLMTLKFFPKTSENSISHGIAPIPQTHDLQLMRVTVAVS